MRLLISGSDWLWGRLSTCAPAGNRHKLARVNNPRAGYHPALPGKLTRYRLLISVLLASAAFGGEPQVHFAVIGAEPGAWPRILSSVGFVRQDSELAQVFVLRAATPASKEWAGRVERGAFVILEGESPVAESFGFQGGKERVSVGSIVDARRPKLPIIWQKRIDAPLFAVPKGAHVFAAERWTGAPVLAGYRRGAGAVLWVATSPGELGYERFPYLLHALADLGLEAPFRSARLWAFFDDSYRTRVDLDYFAARWRAAGIGALHVAAWHFYEADRERDAYLANLIAACHRKGILVYAWLELPHVSEKFWNDHPEWREKTAVLQDAQLDWRKLMNLNNRDCFHAVSDGVKTLVTRFDWDGVNLAELYFESLEGASNPARFTPMNDDVRRSFQQASGFDPIELFGARKDEASLRAFLDFRAGLAFRMQQDWLAQIGALRSVRPNLDLTLTHVDDRLDNSMRDAIGADAGRALPLMDEHDFTFLIEDPATVWHLGPQRYPEIARRYQPLTAHAGKLAIDINVADRYQDVYPTRQQTGAELFELVHLAAGAFPRVALYFENSILAPDLKFLPAAAASVQRVEKVGTKWVIESPNGVGVAWTGGATVDGKSWPVADGATVWLPAGSHSLEAGGAAAGSRVLDFNGNLESAEALPGGELRFAYSNSSRAIAILEKRPASIELDGAASAPELLASGPNWALLLPRGKHTVRIR
jgi:hypothetical protein